MRSDQRLVAQASLVQMMTPELAQVRTVVGVVPPISGTVTLETAPTALLRPIATLNTPYIAGQQLTVTIDLATDLHEWPVYGGALQGMLVEQYIPFTAPESGIRLGDDGIRAYVRNTLDQPLRDVVVAYGEQFVALGDIAPATERSAPWPFQVTQSTPPPPGVALENLILRDATTGDPGDRQAALQSTLIAAAVRRGTMPSAPGPWLLAWLDQSPVDVAVLPPGAARRTATLLVDRPTIEASGNITLPPGWLRPQIATPGLESCTGNMRGDALGVVPRQAAFTVPLQLPDELATVQATELTLVLESLAAGARWPNTGVSTELYNWQAQRWQSFDYDGPGALSIAEPAPYVEHGRVLLRMGGRIDEARCLFVAASLSGVIP
ncbi:MAG: hypothetical protein HC914_16570 [Chloroflexaceae bacterium]|nr:hypothetical protein [Chloroflexaceae bacterium]